MQRCSVAGERRQPRGAPCPYAQQRAVDGYRGVPACAVGRLVPVDPEVSGAHTGRSRSGARAPDLGAYRRDGRRRARSIGEARATMAIALDVDRDAIVRERCGDGVVEVRDALGSALLIQPDPRRPLSVRRPPSPRRRSWCRRGRHPRRVDHDASKRQVTGWAGEVPAERSMTVGGRPPIAARSLAATSSTSARVCGRPWSTMCAAKQWTFGDNVGGTIAR